MPRGRRKSTNNRENALSATPRSGIGRKSARWTVRKTSVSRQSKASNGRRNSNATFSKDKKPWEESDDEADYRHYGSDLDSENDDDIIKEEPAEDELSEASDDVNDIVVREDAENAIFCPWKEIPKDELPALNLPCSSSDLLIDKDHLFDALEVYEILRVYHRTIQISPFLFEDFCCAMRSPAQSNLLCEIHIALLRLLFRDDEDEQTLYSVQDTNNSFNILFQLLEPMTFAEVWFDK
ncbi:DDT domain-containing protein [Ditylenchus destructor]|uniref:DDT domain-containing protein n=1 Tax=Ditylenchus destructor TaxID=166010 RepID=A0AAD4MQU6_9BILA|nr:DDT domain-containing protein [Ditylenchus destructor]